MLQHVIPQILAMVVHSFQWLNKEQTRFSDQGANKEQLKCDYCETCTKLH